MENFAEYCVRVERHLTGHYGITIITRDIPDPLLGDLDGAEIHLDHLATSEQRLFLLAHLFGHTAQWNLHPRALEIGKLHEPPVAEDLLAEVIAYERDAAGLALAMFHEIGIHDLDQWLSDYTACDMAYLGHFYRTGEKKDFDSFKVSAAPLIDPVTVPHFVAKRRAMRSDGIVI